MNNRLRGFVFAAASATTYGMNPLFTLPLYKSGMDTDSVLFFRYGFALLMIGLLMKIKGISFKINYKEIPLLFLIGILFSCSSLFLFLSYHYMDVGIASTILFVYPVMVAVIMWVFFKEKLSFLTIACIALSLIGIWLLYQSPNGIKLSTVGIVMVLLSSLTYALYMVLVNKTSVRNLPVLKLTFYALLFGIILYTVRLDFLFHLVIPSSPILWSNLLGLAFFPTVLSLIMIALAIQCIGSTNTAIFGALEPVTAVIIGNMVFGEHLTFRIIAGILLILLSVTLIVTGHSLGFYVKTRIMKWKL